MPSRSISTVGLHAAEGAAEATRAAVGASSCREGGAPWPRSHWTMCCSLYHTPQAAGVFACQGVGAYSTVKWTGFDESLDIAVALCPKNNNI